ncbi:MAG: porin [Cyanobium sp. NAT70]|nr:porin [Cyanobium sp. NAT70]
MAIIRGRVDGLEARVGELEATQFSTTTKLKGKATFALGATHAKGDNFKARGFDHDYLYSDSEGNPIGARRAYNSRYGAFNFSYDLRLGLATSFTGKDLLFARLRSANMDNAFNGAGTNLTKLDFSTNTNNQVKIDRLYYRFPLGRNFTVISGPLMRNTEALGYKPSAYGRSANTQLGFFGGHLGIPAVWSKTTGGGFGAIYRSNHEKGDAFWTVAANYVAENANDGNSSKGGFMTDNANGALTSQVAYGNKQWGLAVGYRYSQCDTSFKSGTAFAAANHWHQNCYVGTNQHDANGNRILERSEAENHSWSLSAFWTPEDSGWVPSVSAGVAKAYLAGNKDYRHSYSGQADKFASWMVGLQWSDVFLQGNDLGFAVGQPQFVASQRHGGSPEDGNYALELWYQFEVTDNIAVTPGVYWLSRPWGDYTPEGKSLGVFGGVVQTVFKF